MSKFAKVDSKLLREVVAAVEACWIDGSPVAGHSPEQWQGVAYVAIRRIRSFARRKVSAADRAAQIRDIAWGLVEVFEANPKLVGPLLLDYERVADTALAAVRRFEADAA